MARRWAGGGQDTRQDDLAAFGLVADLDDEEIEVWPDNLETVEAFLACQTQWAVGETSGQVRGLRYADVSAALEMLGCTDRRAVFEGVRMMEAAALEVFSARRDPH